MFLSCSVSVLFCYTHLYPPPYSAECTLASPCMTACCCPLNMHESPLVGFRARRPCVLSGFLSLRLCASAGAEPAATTTRPGFCRLADQLMLTTRSNDDMFWNGLANWSAELMRTSGRYRGSCRTPCSFRFQLEFNTELRSSERDTAPGKTPVCAHSVWKYRAAGGSVSALRAVVQPETLCVHSHFCIRTWLAESRLPSCPSWMLGTEHGSSYNRLDRGLDAAKYTCTGTAVPIMDTPVTKFFFMLLLDHPLLGDCNVESWSS